MRNFLKYYQQIKSAWSVTWVTECKQKETEIQDAYMHRLDENYIRHPIQDGHSAQRMNTKCNMEYYKSLSAIYAFILRISTRPLGVDLLRAF